jgi:preprotein translocase subunit SecD
MELTNLIKVISLLTLVLIMASIIYKPLSGLLLIFAIFLFGLISTYAKKVEEKISILVALLVISIVVLFLNGIKFGIDFKGGTRIPLLLSSAVDMQTMAEITDKLKTRLSTLGLEQIVVKPIGDDRIFIEIPQGSVEQINKIENVVTTQGVFIAVVDEKIVLEGKDIIPGTITPSTAQSLGGADWGVSFTITREAAEKFNKLVRGKANKPLLLFLDKPYNATIIISSTWLSEQSSLLNASPADIFDLMRLTLKDEKGTVKILLDSQIENNLESLENESSIITTKDIADKLKLKNVTIVKEQDLYPQFGFGPNNELFINKWSSAGLMSAPLLNPSVTSGNSISLTYQITGSAPANITLNEKAKYAKEQEKFISSVLKGGALPVKLYIGSRETIPAPLGELFLTNSLYALILSIAAVSIFVALRYRQFKLILPIVSITLVELVILIATIGSFSIDLSAMAGLIAAMGVSIDAQIIITDEIKKTKDKQEALKKAFSIINSNVFIAVLVFLPLFFTHIVEITGFAVVAIISYILGALVSRPAYAAMLEIFLKDAV